MSNMRRMVAITAALTIVLATRASSQRIHQDTTRISLGDVVRVALQRNLDIRQADENVRVAASAVTSAKAAFDPTVQVGPTYTSNGTLLAGQGSDLASRFYSGSVQGSLPTGTSYQVGTGFQSPLPSEARRQNSLSATVVQPLLRGFGTRYTLAPVRAADIGVDAARARRARTRNETVASIEASYYLLIQQERAREVAERSLQRAEDLLVAYTELRRIGKITEIDLTTARLGVASRRASLLALTRARQDAQDALVLTAYGEHVPDELLAEGRVLFPTDTVLAVPGLVSVDTSLGVALAERPDIAAARFDLEQNRVLLDLARNSRLPSLGLALGVSTLALTHDPFGFSAGAPDAARFTDLRAGLQVTYPIGNQAAKADAERADAFTKGATLALAQAENFTRGEVRSAYRGITIGRERLALSGEAMRLAREQYDGERERLRLGLSDIFRLLQYEEQVAQAEFEETSAWFDLATAGSRYRAATGQSVRAYGAP